MKRVITVVIDMQCDAIKTKDLEGHMQDFVHKIHREVDQLTVEQSNYLYNRMKSKPCVEVADVEFERYRVETNIQQFIGERTHYA